MKLLLIYGPPAAGKMTVANKIADKTNFVVFHNHKTIDLYKEVMDFGTEDFWEKVSNLRFDLIELAAKNNKNMIITLCYEPGDEYYVERLKDIVLKYNSKIYYARLICDAGELKKRVTEESRKSHGKIKTVEEIEKSLKNHDYSQTIKEPNSIVIDNNKKSADWVANEIIENFSFF